MSFSHPAMFLISLLAVPLYFAARDRSHIGYSDVGLLDGVVKFRTLPKLASFVLVLALVSASAVLAGPTTEGGIEEVKREGRDILLLLDVSGSMSGMFGNFENLNPRGATTKIEIAKSSTVDFIDARSDHDRIGMYVFGSEALGVWPLSFDHGVLIRRIQGIDASSPISVGTYIYKALVKGISHFEDAESKSPTRVAVIISDGDDTGSFTLSNKARLIRDLKEMSIKVYWIDISGGKARKDLHDVSSLTGGKAFLAGDTGELRAVLSEIDDLETALITEFVRTGTKDNSMPFLILLLVFLAIGYLGTRVWEM